MTPSPEQPEHESASRGKEEARTGKFVRSAEGTGVSSSPESAAEGRGLADEALLRGAAKSELSEKQPQAVEHEEARRLAERALEHGNSDLVRLPDYERLSPRYRELAELVLSLVDLLSKAEQTATQLKAEWDEAKRAAAHGAIDKTELEREIGELQEERDSWIDAYKGSGRDLEAAERELERLTEALRAKCGLPGCMESARCHVCLPLSADTQRED